MVVYLAKTTKLGKVEINVQELYLNNGKNRIQSHVLNANYQLKKMVVATICNAHNVGTIFVGYVVNFQIIRAITGKENAICSHILKSL